MRRTRADWIVSFLTDPQAEKPGTAMPGLVSPEEAEALAHYLAKLKDERTPFRLWREVNAEQGGVIYHGKGCVACHDPSPDFPPAEGPRADFAPSYPSASHPDYREKTDLVSLAAFLRRPHETRPHGRMPDFAFDDETAGNVAAHLMGFRDSNGDLAPRVPAFSVDETKALRGAQLFTARRCGVCHEGSAEPVEPVALTGSSGGCLSLRVPRGLPDYSLTSSQRAALLSYLGVEEDAPPELPLADLTLRALDCLACHTRDGRGGPDPARRVFFTGDPSIGDTGRYPPPLTGVGARLKPEWLAGVLRGEAPRVRPYLDTAMPCFGAATEGLAERLAEADARDLPGLPQGDIEAGRVLLGTAGGLNCITCHRWGERRSLGIQALDLSDLHLRYREGWLRQYLIDPAAHRPGTLMPSFWPGGEATNREILGGDTDRQIASIFAFAAQGEGAPAGYPEHLAGQFEIVPDSAPVVLRTFLEDVGVHAILVGFPEGVHFAYDGRQARPARWWRGRFFDAYHTWFSRHAPFEKPLGDEISAWPAPEGGGRTGRGYSLDEGGVPIFHVEFAGEEFRETLRPRAGGLERILRGPDPVLADYPVAHPEGVEVEEIATGSGVRGYLYRWP